MLALGTMLPGQSTSLSSPQQPDPHDTARPTDPHHVRGETSEAFDLPPVADGGTMPPSVPAAPATCFWAGTGRGGAQVLTRLRAAAAATPADPEQAGRISDLARARFEE